MTLYLLLLMLLPSLFTIVADNVVDAECHASLLARECDGNVRVLELYSDAESFHGCC